MGGATTAGVRLGAGVPYTRIIERPRRPRCRGWRWPPARSARRRSAIRGTVGGNLGSASPAGDAHPPLLAAGAVVEVASAARGTRRIPAAEFYTGVKRNALEPDELIAAVLIPRARAGRSSSPRSAPATPWSSRSARSPARCTPSAGRSAPASARPRRRRGARREAEEFLAGELDGAGLWESRGELPESLARRVRRAVAAAASPDRRRARQRRLPAALAVGDGPARAHLGLGRLPARPARGGLTMRVTTTVNGTEHAVDDVWPGESLLYVLRERLGLPGSKNACEQGECGSCTVYLDGVPVCACLVAAGQAIGREVVTVEGLADGDALHPVQQAFVEAGAVQCGFCTPGPGRRRARPARAGAAARRPGDPRGARRQPVPLHRLREDPGRRPAGRRPGRRRHEHRHADGDPDRPPPSRTGRHRRQPAAARRHAQGDRRVRLRQRPVARRDGRGASRCAARTRTPASAASTSPTR